MKLPPAWRRHPDMTKAEYAIEWRCRWACRKHSLRLEKDRVRYHSAQHRGGYRIVGENGTVVLGAGFTMTLERVEQFCRDLMDATAVVTRAPLDIREQVVTRVFQAEVEKRVRQMAIERLKDT